MAREYSGGLLCVAAAVAGPAVARAGAEACFPGCACYEDITS